MVVCSLLTGLLSRPTLGALLLAASFLPCQQPTDTQREAILRESSIVAKELGWSLEKSSVTIQDIGVPPNNTWFAKTADFTFIVRKDPIQVVSAQNLKLLKDRMNRPEAYLGPYVTIRETWETRARQIVTKLHPGTTITTKKFDFLEPDATSFRSSNARLVRVIFDVVYSDSHKFAATLVMDLATAKVMHYMCARTPIK